MLVLSLLLWNRVVILVHFEWSYITQVWRAGNEVQQNLLLYQLSPLGLQILFGGGGGGGGG